MVISCDFFYCINGNIVRKHKLNDALSDESFRYDTSVARQEAALDIIADDIKSVYKLCKEYKKEMPIVIKLIYDTTKNSVKADYEYDFLYTEDPKKTVDDIVREWFEEVKSLGDLFKATREYFGVSDNSQFDADAPQRSTIGKDDHPGEDGPG